MAALQNVLDEFLSVNARDNFHRRQPRAGMSDVRTQPFGIVSENLTTLASARDADVKLLLVDGRQ